MKNMKKFLAALVVISAVCVSAFAYEFDASALFCDNMGSCSRSEFESEMENLDMDLLKGAITEGFTDDEMDVTLTKFEKLEEEVLDEEDVAMHDFVVNKISSSVDKNDAVQSLLIRGISEDGIMDGWMVFSHFISKKNVESYIYYFAAEFSM